MKTDLINIGSSLGLDKLPSLSSFGGLIDGASKLQGFLIESEKTEQIKAQANAFTHHSDNEAKVAIRTLESKDLETRARIRQNDQKHEEVMFSLLTQAKNQTELIQIVNNLIKQGNAKDGIEIIKILYI